LHQKSLITIMMSFFQNLKTAILLGTAFLYETAHTQTNSINDTAIVSTPVTIGVSVKLNSNVLHQQYELYISTPYGYEKNNQKYPVIYVLDGKYYFPYVSAASEVLSGNQDMPECIVVGIASINRNRDYSPPLVAGFDKPGPMSAAGGANTYLQHIEQEVLPFIDAHYRTQPYRMLIGHSLGGLLVVHAMVTKPNLFQAYIDIDGSHWFNNGANGDSLISFLSQHPKYKGNFMWVMEKMDSSYWFPVTHRLHAFLAANKPAGLNYEFIQVENDHHSTLIFPGAYLALRDMFANYAYQFKPTTNLGDIKHHYDSLSAALKFTVAIPEDLYDEDKEHCIQILKDPQKAMVTCTEWIKVYPNSARAYEVSGNLCITLGDKTNAAKYLNKALQLDPSNKAVKNSLQSISN